MRRIQSEVCKLFRLKKAQKQITGMFISWFANLSNFCLLIKSITCNVSHKYDCTNKDSLTNMPDILNFSISMLS